MRKKKRGHTDVTENHKMTDGKLLQTDKKYAQLKLKQKEKIAEWMFQVTRDYYTKNYTFPNDRQIEKVVNIVYEKSKKQRSGFLMEKCSGIINLKGQLLTGV